MTNGTRWVSMLSAAAALALLMMMPVGGEHAPLVPEAVQAAQGEACDKDAKPAALDYTMKDMNGVDVKLASFKGKVIIVNFWATWCGPCKAEIPGFVELQKQYASDLVILGISVDDPIEKLKPYAAQYKINYPILVGLGRDDVQEAYGPLYGIPASFVIGRDGRVCKKHMGIAPKAQFEREIKALL
jgi:thiol-disulfide isomerase/thioredoxin